MPSLKSNELIKAINAMPVPKDGLRIMEVCGTHTMAIAKSGLRSLLPAGIKLVSGPGCPVCVTDGGDIESCLALCEIENVIVCCYGDMLKVPGKERGDSLLKRKATGAGLRVLFSPMDAVKLACENPQKELVFIGVGFETTAPGTAAALEKAREEGINNFSVMPLLKRVEPALRALAALPDFSIDALLCPGHVASVIGADGFAFAARELKLPSVVAGFESEDILLAIWRLLLQKQKGEAVIENMYPRAVKKEGNQLALNMISKVFEPCAARWRGLGLIEESGYALKEPYAFMDARRRFSLKEQKSGNPACCRCGEIICGLSEPVDCSLFAKECTPEEPVGPCMVSSEGACAAAYKYGAL